jgi:predicted  nucleic acid-binding Zn-ribbon protein
MNVTEQLLRVFQVDQQIRGLQSRLNAAETFLKSQQKDLAEIAAAKKAVEATLLQHTLVASDNEGEVKRLDEKLSTLRTQMNSAQTNKEYQAFLVELNTFKTARDKHEVVALEAMTKVEELRKQVAELDAKAQQRDQVRDVAAKERDARFAEIETRLNELKAEREKHTADVPENDMRMFQRLLDQRGDQAMGSVEIIDRKRHEYNCGVCYMALPMEAVSGLLSGGKLTRCSSCQCVLYLNADAMKAMQPSNSKR